MRTEVVGNNNEFYQKFISIIWDYFNFYCSAIFCSRFSVVFFRFHIILQWFWNCIFRLLDLDFFTSHEDTKYTTVIDEKNDEITQLCKEIAAQGSMIADLHCVISDVRNGCNRLGLCEVIVNSEIKKGSLKSTLIDGKHTIDSYQIDEWLKKSVEKTS